MFRSATVVTDDGYHRDLPTRLLTIGVGITAGMLTVAVLAHSLSGPDRRTLQPSERVPTAAGFLDSVGVNTHFNYTDTSYARRDTILQRLRVLGVRHLRDSPPVNAPALAAGLRGAALLNVNATLIAGDLRVDPNTAVERSRARLGRRVVAFEAPNEIDNAGLPDWPAELRTRMATLESAVDRHAPRVPLLGPSFIDPVNYNGLDRSRFQINNLHPYPGGLAPERPLMEALAGLRSTGAGGPVVFTETGYHNALNARSGQPAASEDAAAVYLPRMLLKSFAAGVKRTFIYELADEKRDPDQLEPEQHFGLLREDLSAKPGFHAVRNLLAAVRKRPSGPRRRAPAPVVAGGPDPVERVDLKRQDGSRVLALWRPVSVWDRLARRPVDPGVKRIEIRWPRAARNIMVSRPSLDSRPRPARLAARRMVLGLAGDVVLISYR